MTLRTLQHRQPIRKNAPLDATASETLLATEAWLQVGQLNAQAHLEGTQYTVELRGEGAV
jgi:hypothetical protein